MSGTGVLGESFAPVVLSTAACGPAGPGGPPQRCVWRHDWPLRVVPRGTGTQAVARLSQRTEAIRIKLGTSALAVSTCCPCFEEDREADGRRGKGVRSALFREAGQKVVIVEGGGQLPRLCGYWPWSIGFTWGRWWLGLGWPSPRPARP